MLLQAEQMEWVKLRVSLDKGMGVKVASPEVMVTEHNQDSLIMCQVHHQFTSNQSEYQEHQEWECQV
jgi:hypothetical protein